MASVIIPTIRKGTGKDRAIPVLKVGVINIFVTAS